MPIKAVINIEVGEEVVLYVLVSNPLLGRLAKIKELQLRFNFGVARNDFGPLGFLLFWIPYVKLLGEGRFAQRLPWRTCCAK